MRSLRNHGYRVYKIQFQVDNSGKDFWLLTYHLPDWPHSVVPTAAPEQYQRIYAIRTNPIEQDNHLVYVAYTLDEKTMELGIVRELHPTQVEILTNSPHLLTGH